MDWIDEVIRCLCELPDRSSPDDDPEAIVATRGEIRAAIEVNMPEDCTAELEMLRAAIQKTIDANRDNYCDLFDLVATLKTTTGEQNDSHDQNSKTVQQDHAA